MIPKTIHQVWLGTKPIPEELIGYAGAWRKHHPEWDLILWTDRPTAHRGPWTSIQEHPPIINRYAFHWAERWFGARAAWAARSDILRMELVARYGGVYADLDVEPFEAINPLLEGVRLFCADEWGPCPGNYLFGAAVNHPAVWGAVRDLWKGIAPVERPKSLLSRAANLIRRRRAEPLPRLEGSIPPERRWLPILQVTGPYYLNAALARHAEFVCFPWQLFNPLPAYCNHRMVTRWPDHACGNHHYAGTWYDRSKIPPPREFTREGA